MKERFAIQLSLDEEEKKDIIDTYKKHGINTAGRVLNIIRKDVKELKGNRNE